MKTDLGQLKVLLAEDAASMRKIEVGLLREIGISKILEAENGEVAVQLLRKEGRVDLILSDWNMPGRSGISFLQWLRSEEAFKDIPFVMATAQSDKEQSRVAMEAGADGVLAKPFSQGELEDIVRAVCGERKETDKTEFAKIVIGASGKVILRIAHIQITDHIILGVLKHLIQTNAVHPQHFELETRCMPSWNPVSQAIEEGTVEGAFIMAPIAMDLFRHGVPIKLVLLAHRGGSICVRSNVGKFTEPHQDFFRGRSFLIPHKLSIHHMLAHHFFKHAGLKASLEKGTEVDVNLEVAPPIKMPSILKEETTVSGFMVAEPIGTKTIAAGLANLQFLSNELWPGHPCCVVTMREEMIQKHGEAVRELVGLLAYAGRFVTEQPGKAAEIAVPFLDPQGNLKLRVPVLKNVLTERNGIRTDHLYPTREDIHQIQEYMVREMGIGRLVDLERFIDARYADDAYKGKPAGQKASILSDSPDLAKELLGRGGDGRGIASVSKTMLNKEGKYLTFSLGNQEFGIDILKIKEIIGLMEISGLPQAHRYIKGVINLRDRVIPVMDLRMRFNMEAKGETDRNCIVIVEGEQKSRKCLLGLIVDSVSEVLSIRADDIEETPSFTSNINTSYILAMAKKADKVRILLNMDRVLAF